MSYSARNAALNILGDVCGDGYLNLVLKKYLPLLKDQEDRRFCTALVSTAIENLIRIDYVVDRFLKKRRIQKVVRNILRLGVCQLMFFESVPESAAVNESVRLCQKCGKTQMKGFVNGVLRNIACNLGNMEYPDEKTSPAGYLSIMFSYPMWLCEKYIVDYGYDFTYDMLSYSADHSLTCIRLRRGNIPKGASAAKYAKNMFYLKNAMSMDSFPEFSDGSWTVMSEASVLCVDAAGIKNGDTVIDVCAAPGGKSSYAAEKCRRLTACDIYDHRIGLLGKTFSRLGIDNAEAVCADASIYDDRFSDAFDVVICDAPCSALGLLYRKPDIKIHKRADDIDELRAVQKSILDNCSLYVKKGGTLLYSTCTINKYENEANVEQFLKNHHNFSLVDFSSRVHEEFSARAKNGMLQLYPHIDGIDGFFISVMRRDS